MASKVLGSGVAALLLQQLASVQQVQLWAFCREPVLVMVSGRCPLRLKP